MNKIIFLIKSKSPFTIILYFLMQKISNIFSKRKIIKYKKNHQIFLKDKKITNDFFSSNTYNFYYFCSKINSNFRYLEIGSYEGNSALFIANSFKFSKIYCVDNWVGTQEYTNHNFQNIENNFDYNVKNYNNINKIKDRSDNFFFKNNFFFDIIYIDGYHLGSQVYKDCINSWKFLKKDGLLICDDYIWNGYEDIKENPCFAINKFLTEIKDNYKLLKVSNSQIFIKKIKP